MTGRVPVFASLLTLAIFAATLLFAFLRARKKPMPPPGPPPSSPLAPTILPPVGAATVTQGLAPDKKVCPRCHTMVNGIDVTCFFRELVSATVRILSQCLFEGRIPMRKDEEF